MPVERSIRIVDKDGNNVMIIDDNGVQIFTSNLVPSPSSLPVGAMTITYRPGIGYTLYGNNNGSIEILQLGVGAP